MRIMTYENFKYNMEKPLSNKVTLLTLIYIEMLRSLSTFNQGRLTSRAYICMVFGHNYFSFLNIISKTLL